MTWQLNSSKRNGAALVGLALAVCGIALARLLRRRRLFSSLPPMCPLSMRETLREMTARGTPPGWLYRTRHELGTSVFRLRIPALEHFVVVCDAETARTILLDTKAEKPQNFYKPMAQVTGGIGTIFTKKTHGEGWEHARKGSAHAFTSVRISNNMAAAAPHLADLDAVMAEHARGQAPMPVSETMVRLTVDIIGSTGFGGYPMNALLDSDEASASDGRQFMLDLETALLEFTSKQTLNPLRRFTHAWHPEVIEAKAAALRLMHFAQRILDVYRASGRCEHDADSLIAHLCNNQMYPSDSERCADVLTYLVAGHDTTGYTLSWILCELARNPEIQDKLAGEVEEKGTESPYLQLIIKEGLRLHPVGALGSIRTCATDVATRDGGVIPAGSSCLMPFYVIFREGWIENPTSFVPERWKVGAPQAKDLERLIFPFSLGRRDCIGQRMAMAQLRTVLAHISPRYKLSIAREPVSDYFLTLKPANAFLHVSLREQGPKRA